MASNLQVVEQIAERLFVGGGDHIQALVAAVTESLPQYIDDLTRDLGPDVYDRMLTHTSVSSAVETRRLSVVSAPIQIAPAVGADPEDENDIRNVLATKVRADIEAGSVDLRAVADELWDGLLYGIKFSEIQLHRVDQRLVPKTVVGLDNRTYVVVQGLEGELLGVAPAGMLTPELETLLREGQDNDLTRDYWRHVVPAWKLMRLANRPRNGKAIGGSILRPAYQPYFSDTTLVPEYLKHQARFGSPSVLGKLPVNVQEMTVKKDDDGLPITDEDGRPLVENAVRALFQQLITWRNGSVLAVPGGTEIDVLWPDGKGVNFLEGREFFKREIHETILGTAQATTEARAESRSSKDVAQDVVGLRVSDDRLSVGSGMGPLMRLLVTVNEGEQYARYAPSAFIAESEQQDLNTVSSAFERLQRTPGALLPGQRRWFWKKLGIPVDETEFAEDMEQRRADREARRGGDAELEELLAPDDKRSLPLYGG